MKCTNCGSYAINHHLHGRDGTCADLCDVCFWRARADESNEQLQRLRAAVDNYIAGPSLRAMVTLAQVMNTLYED